MGSSMKPTVFNDEVAEAVKSWHHKAKKKAKYNLHSEKQTPTHGMSPVHLLHNDNHHSEAADDLFPPPDASVVVEMYHWDAEGSRSPKSNNVGPSERGGIRQPSNVRELGQIQEHPPSLSFSQPEVISPSGLSSARARK